MATQNPEPDPRIEELSRRLERVEQRLLRLERGASASALHPSTAAPGSAEALAVRGGQEEPVSAHDGWFSMEALPLFGRTLVVLGGGFLLRAITERGIVHQVTGTALGIAYAMLWIVFVDRAAAKNRRLSARFHGLAATSIAFPLLWEATVQFKFLSPPWSVVALAAITGLALAVVGRRRLGGLAWVVTLAAAITALALAVSTSLWTLYVFELLLLALVAIWIGYERKWQRLAWTVSTAVSATLLLMTLIVLVADPEQVWRLMSPDALVSMQLSWVVIFFASLGYRKLSRNEDLTPGEIALGLLTLGVGFGGATAVTRATPVAGTSLGLVGLVLAAGLYAMAFFFADRKLHRRGSFVFYSTLALLVTLIASSTLLEGMALPLTFAFASLVTAVWGSRMKRATLSLHGAVYILAAATTSGLAVHSVRAFVSKSLPGLGWLAVDMLCVVVVAAIFCGLPVAEHGRTWGRFTRIPKFSVTVVLCVGVGAIAVSLLSLPLARDASDPLPMMGGLAAIRTGVLAVSAVLLAWLSRRGRWPETSWLVYPVLVVGGIKLVVEDLPAGRPVTLFFSFVLYGVALILAPRLTRQRQA